MKLSDLEFVGWGTLGEPRGSALIYGAFDIPWVDAAGSSESDYWDGDDFRGPDDRGIVPIYRERVTGAQFPAEARLFEVLLGMSESKVISMRGERAPRIAAAEAERFHEERIRMQRRAKHQAVARILYRVWAYRVGSMEAWEDLAAVEMEAWREVAAQVEDFATERVAELAEEQAQRI